MAMVLGYGGRNLVMRLLLAHIRKLNTSAQKSTG